MGAGEAEEAEGDTGFGAGEMVAQFGYLPLGGVDVGEKCVGIGRCGGIDHGEVEHVGVWEECTVYLSAADYEHCPLGGGGGQLQGGFGRLCRFHSVGTEVRVAGDNDVAAVGEGAFWERLKCVAAHHHGVAGGEFLEVLQVLGDVEQEVATAANGGAVGSYGGYNRNHN